MSQTKVIKIVAITGSVQPNNFTSKTLALVVDEIKKHPHTSVEVIDPAQMDLTLPGKEEGSSNVLLQKIVGQATGVVLATPEYHGSYSSVIKLVIDNLGYPSVLSGKPVSLLGVASGRIGAIKALEHLRGVCSHVGAIVLPDTVSIAEVHKLFNEEGRCTDKKIEQKIRSLATNLLEYIENHHWPREAQEESVRN